MALQRVNELPPSPDAGAELGALTVEADGSATLGNTPQNALNALTTAMSAAEDAQAALDVANAAQDTADQAVTDLGGKVSKTGDTMTGPLAVPTPVGASDAANKAYVDAQSFGSTTVWYGSLPPVEPIYQRWVDLDSGSEYWWTGDEWAELGGAPAIPFIDPSTFYGSTAPSTDLYQRWVDTDSGGEYWWTGDEWVELGGAPADSLGTTDARYAPATLVPTSATMAEAQSILDSGAPLVQFRGDYVLNPVNVGGVNSNSLRPHANQTLEMVAGSSVRWGTTGPYYPLFLVTEDNVTFRGFNAIHTGDFVTPDAEPNKNGEAYSDGFYASAFIEAYSCDRLQVHNLKIAGNTPTNVYGAVVRMANCTNVDIHDIAADDHCEIIFTGSGCTGTVDTLLVGRQSPKSQIHYGAPHAVYSFSGELNISNVIDTGQFTPHGAYTDTLSDGHTIKVKTGGASTALGSVTNIASRRAAGILYVASVHSLQASGLRYRYEGTHPGLTALEGIITAGSGGGEVAAAYIDISDVVIELDGGDITPIQLYTFGARVQARVTRNTAIASTKPILYLRGENNTIDLTYNNITHATATRILELDTGAGDNSIRLAPMGGFRDFPPRVAISNSLAGVAPFRNRIDVVGVPLPFDGWDVSTMTLNNSLTLTTLLDQTWMVDGTVRMYDRQANAQTSISISQSFGQIRPGAYLVTIGLKDAGNNHMVMGLYWVVFDDRTNDFTTAQLIGTQIVKGNSGTIIPSSFTLAVSAAGVFTLTATRTLTNALNLFWSVVPLVGLDQT